MGYTKTGLGSYTYWSREKLAGTDVEINDGKGNKIIIGSRECGSRIEIKQEINMEGCI